METKDIKKSNADGEKLIVDAPYTVYGHPSFPRESQSLTMRAGGLRKMLDEFDLDGDDMFRIEWFRDKATEYSFIKKQ